MTDFIVVATADWDHPLWTNKQHVAQSFHDLGHRVLYVESLGLRLPRVEVKDWNRILKRLKAACRLPREVKPGLWVWSPFLIPAAGSYPILQRINRLLFACSLSIIQRWINFRRPVLWTYNPCILDYLGPCPSFQAIVYHCVDDIQSQPGMDRSWIDRSESQLCTAADCVFVTSPSLFETRSVWARSIYYYPNVADYEHFCRASIGSLAEEAFELRSISRPILGFVGALSDYKVNLELLGELAALRSDWSIVLIGPTGEGEYACDLSALTSNSNVHWLGVQGYDRLPNFMHGFDVALLPLRRNSYTQSMFPMKFFEYLAAGIPVVATSIPSLQDFSDLACFPVSDDVYSWEQAIREALMVSPVERQRRESVAAQYTYRQRSRRMLAHLPLAVVK